MGFGFYSGCILLFIERVVLSTNRNLGYSLPNIIEDTNDIQTLIDVIQNDEVLSKMVYAVDHGYNKSKAADIWKRIEMDPNGKIIADKYKNAHNFRISSAMASGDGVRKGEGAYEQQDPANPRSTRPIDYFDKKANTTSGEMESFYDFFTSSKNRPNEVSGGAPKDKPLR